MTPAAPIPDRRPRRPIAWNRIALRFSVLGTVLAFGVASAVADAPAQDTPDRAQCKATFDSCEARCNTEFADDALTRAPCIMRCSGEFLACDAGIAYDKAKPWLDEQAERTRKFFDELLKPPNGGAQPDPQKKTKDNSI